MSNETNVHQFRFSTGGQVHAYYTGDVEKAKKSAKWYANKLRKSVDVSCVCHSNKRWATVPPDRGNSDDD